MDPDVIGVDFFCIFFVVVVILLHLFQEPILLYYSCEGDQELLLLS